MATKKDISKVETTAETTTTEVEPKAVESKYSIADFISNSAMFGTSLIVVKTALELSGKTEFTKNEATEIINKFKNKGVKR
jgi:hypothetical protein